MFKGVIAEKKSHFGLILSKKLESQIFKDLFTITHSLQTFESSKWLEIIPTIDIIFFSANSSEFSSEVVQLINERIKEKKLTLFFFRFVNVKNIAKQLNFYKEDTRSSSHFTYGSYFKLNFKDFDKLFIENYNKLSFNVKHEYDQFILKFQQEIKSMKENNCVHIGDEYMNGVIVKDLMCKDDWYLLGGCMDNTRATILLHKELKVCFCHWYFTQADNYFSNCLLKLTFSYVLFDHLCDKNIVKFYNNLRKCQTNYLLTDIDIMHKIEL